MILMNLIVPSKMILFYFTYDFNSTVQDQKTYICSNDIRPKNGNIRKAHRAFCHNPQIQGKSFNSITWLPKTIRVIIGYYVIN